MKLLFFLMVHVIIAAKSAIIIVHGTWAKNESWYQLHGAFFQAVQATNKNLLLADEVCSFRWSGLLSYMEQFYAAQDLVELIEKYEFVILICHSHGATVGIIASDLLGQKNSACINIAKIKKFYALGVPVERNMSIYPDMSVIDHFYNLFSWADFVQPINGMYARVFEYHERLVNISVTIGSLHPSHSQLHDALLGRDILKIPDYFICNGVLCHAINLSFFEKQCLSWSVESELESKLDLDKKLQWMMQAALFRTIKNQ